MEFRSEEKCTYTLPFVGCVGLLDYLVTSFIEGLGGLYPLKPLGQYCRVMTITSSHVPPSNESKLFEVTVTLNLGFQSYFVTYGKI